MEPDIKSAPGEQLPSPTFEVGTGLQPSRDDNVYHMGHMWLRWINPYNGETAHRGYWPLLDDLPPELADDEARTYLCTNVVRGLYKVDTTGRELEQGAVPVRSRSWQFADDEYYRLVMLYCALQDGVTFRISGLYSCDEAHTTSQNCCSWAVTALRNAKQDANFIDCVRIKRMRHVETAIWGSNQHE